MALGQPAMREHDITGYLEEYRALRAEMLAHMQMQRNTLISFMLIVSGLLGYAIPNNEPLLSLLAWLLTWQFWSLYSKEDLSIYKIGRYIAVYLSDKVEGLEWENKVAEVDPMITKAIYGYERRNWWRKQLRELGTLHFAISMTCLVITVLLVFRKYFNGTPPTLVFLLCLVLALTELLLVVRKGYLFGRDYREITARIFREVKESSTSQST